jgi:parallel beta-helix repeat protein/predicted outer membrane repeat protein
MSAVEINSPESLDFTQIKPYIYIIYRWYMNQFSTNAVLLSFSEKKYVHWIAVLIRSFAAGFPLILRLYKWRRRKSAELAPRNNWCFISHNPLLRRYVMKRLLVFLLFMVFPVAGMAATIHVPGDQPTIQAGIDAAADGDTVLVAPGTYVENIDFLGKAITMISEQGPEVTIIDGSSPSDPDYGSVVTFVSSEGLDSVLNGFTLTNGTGTYYPTLGFLGGGILCDQSSSPTIIHNIITGNSVDYCGGGILCNLSSSPLIAHNTIEENESIGPPVTGGGAIFCRLDSSPTIAYNSLSNNFAAHSGGAIHCIGSCSPQISYNTISGNYTNLADSLGGAMVFYIECAPLITHNIITDNISTGQGGAIACSNSSLTLINNLIEGNSATSNGGGIFVVDDSQPVITNNTITNNSAAHWGGGLYCLGASGVQAPTVTNNLFIGNSADEGGGAISCNAYDSMTLSNNTITENESIAYGGGIECWRSSLVMVNTIFWNNIAPTGPEIWLGDADQPATLTISYSDVEGGESAVYVEPVSTLNRLDTHLVSIGI